MDARRKKLLFQSQHCGMKENDILLGQFAATSVRSMPESHLAAFEALLRESDNDIYDWVIGREPIPARHDNDFMASLLAFNSKSG